MSVVSDSGVSMQCCDSTGVEFMEAFARTHVPVCPSLSMPLVSDP